MATGTILIVDDNPSVLTSLEFLLEEQFKKVITASVPDRITHILHTTKVDLIILDMNFTAGTNSGNEGLFWLNQIQTISPQLPVIMLTAYGDVELAVKAMQQGAADFILKPWDNEQLIEKLTTLLKKNKKNNRGSTPAESTGKVIEEPGLIVGNSPGMLRLYKMIVKVARTDANVLLTGENGTGKEMFAKEIHRLSLRNKKQMISVDMGALSETLMESELFGHVKGAFTDARENHTGTFEAANGGTLFLDEIGNLSLNSQAKLLTALQKREITRVGSTNKIPVDIRLITATNQELPEMVREGKFREDLFYRINTIHITIPPLRERREDIPTFASYFLKKYMAVYKRTGLSFHPDTLKKMEVYEWPGNIRELEHMIEKAIILAEKSIIKPSDLFLRSEKYFTPKEIPNLDELERQAIETAIEQNEGNLKAAAHQLGISRQTLYNKLRKFNS